MSLIAVNGIDLYYESHGTGAPLVVLGGLGLDVSEMGMLTGPLATRFRVIAAPLLTRHERLVAEVSAFLTEGILRAAGPGGAQPGRSRPS